MRSKLKRMSLEQLGALSIDEKIALALEELENLPRWRFKRREQLEYALECWWMTKGFSVR